ncbi:MAG: LPS-assembly protein LptD, partial [Flavobacteriaceae bacterium]
DNEEETEVIGKLYRNSIPWNMNLQFTSGYTNAARENNFTNASLMFSGNLDLTPEWKIRFSSGYDFTNKGFNLTQLGFRRDLKSFDLRFNWVPFGNNTRWDFFIGIKSSMLSDLKWESRSQRNVIRR